MTTKEGILSEKRILLTEKRYNILYEIESLYRILNETVKFEFNDSTLRGFIIDMFLRAPKLNGYIKKIICDETINTPEIIDDGILIARLYYELSNRMHKVDLTFGLGPKYSK